MSVPFIVVTVCAAACAWLAQKRGPQGRRFALSVVVLIAVAAAGFYFFAGPRTLGTERWWQESPWREIALFVSMLTGMSVRYVTNAIEERRARLVKWKDNGSMGARPGLDIDKWEFAYPLLVSALTFGTLLSQTKSDSLTLQTVLLSFQTGFFWQTLLAAKTKPTSA